MKNRIKIIFLLAALATNHVLSAAKPEPSGIYALVFGADGKPTDLTDNPLLTNPNVDGFRYKAAWKAVQPTSQAEFNWDHMDAQIAIAAAAGKQMGISIAAGLATPDWVYTASPTVYRYHMLEIDPATGLSIGDQPLPWDTTYQAKWLNFVTMLGARYDGNPNVSYVVIGGFMESSTMSLVATLEDDAAVNVLAQDPPPGYTGLRTRYTDSSAAYIPAAETIIAEFMQAFPTTPVILTLGNPFPTEEGIADQGTIKNWALDTYPRRFGTMVSALYATTPPHDPPGDPLPYPKGFQMVCKASDAAKLYLDPDPVPLPPAPIPLQDALEHGVTLGGKYVEVYADDLYLAKSQPVLVIERAKLKSNVYGGPTPTPTPTPARDYSLSISPASVTVKREGGSAVYTITVNPTGGFNSSVTMSVSGLPPGTTGSFSPNPATTYSTLTLTVGASTSKGTYVFTATGVGGSPPLARTTTGTLVKTKQG